MIELIFWIVLGITAFAVWFGAGYDVLLGYEHEHGDAYKDTSEEGNILKLFIAIMVWPLYLYKGIMKTTQGT